MRDLTVELGAFTVPVFEDLFHKQYLSCCNRLGVGFNVLEYNKALVRAKNVFVSIIRDDLDNHDWVFGNNIVIKANDTKYNVSNLDNDCCVLYRKGFLFYLVDKDSMPKEMRFLPSYGFTVSKTVSYETFLEFISVWVSSIAFNNVCPLLGRR